MSDRLLRDPDQGAAPLDTTPLGGALPTSANALADAVYLLDDAGCILDVNCALEWVSGFARDELIGQAATRFVEAASAEHAAQVIRAILADPQRRHGCFDLQARHPDGDLRVYESRVTPLIDVAGRMRESIGVMRDVTEARRLKNRRLRYERVFEGAHEGMLVVAEDAHGELRYLEANPAVGAIVGLDASAMVGQRPIDVFAASFARNVERLYRRALDDDEDIEITHTNPAPRGEITTRSRIQPIPGPDVGTQALVLIEDITESASAERELERERQALKALYEVAGERDLAPRTRLRRLLEIGCERLGLAYGFITEIDDDEQHILQAVGDHALLQPGETAPLEQSYCRYTIAEDDLVAYDDAAGQGWQGDPAHELFDLGCYLGGRLDIDGSLLGTLCFADRSPRAHQFGESELAFVRLLTAWVRRELERERLLERLSRLARTDGLTGLLNHRELMQRLDHELGRAERSGGALTLLLVDVDHFKQVNDTFGHRCGDTILRAVAQVLADETREVDIAGRYGGEEFALLLPNTALASGLTIAERLVARVREQRHPEVDSALTVTVSIGAAERSGDAATASDLLQRADDQLYRAKNEGRDRVRPTHAEASHGG